MRVGLLLLVARTIAAPHHGGVADTTELPHPRARERTAVRVAHPAGVVGRATKALRPIRTNTPGTGVFIGSGLLLRTLYDRESGGSETLEGWTAVADFRYTPATHWVIGARVPVVLDRRLERPGAGTVSRSGLGDASVAVKHRFFRQVGAWSDRHAAVELEVRLPTGESDLAEVPSASELPMERRRRLTPGLGGVGFAADLIYQEGRRRFVYGGDVSFRVNTEGGGDYRVGNEARLNLDLEYVLFPLEYRRPGNEVFVLLEATVRRKWADDTAGRSLPSTERTDVLVAPALQHILTQRMLASLSVQLPLVSDAPRDGLEQELNVLAELRFAF